jgi:hypothetical protein
MSGVKHPERNMPKAETPKKAPKRAQKAQTIPSQGVGSQEPPKTPKKIGRPSKYTPEIAKEMCELLADGVPLREICRKEGFPEWRTVYDWMYRDDKEMAAGRGVGLSASIARAREVGQDAIAEQIWLDMNQTPERILSEGGGRVDSGYVQWQKAKAEIGIKLLAKWNPKRYGDRVTMAGDAENPLRIDAESQADKMMAALLQNLELKRQDGSR